LANAVEARVPGDIPVPNSADFDGKSRYSMALVVVNYPTISERDYIWIQGIRAEHDIYYEIVSPHFTLVFPCSITDEAGFVAHIERRAKRVKRIHFVLRCALVVKDCLSRYTHVFLIPDDGFSGTVRLHDRLYTGLLASELRLDIPFLPHIGVGSAVTPGACKDLAQDLNEGNFSIEGTIDSLDITSFDGKSMKTIERIRLGQD
jgi:2'-5' RNA ligase